MDDGAYARGGFYLHTKGFAFREAYMLAGMLHYNFDLYCNVQNHKGQPVIYITAESMGKFTAIVKPHFHKDMLYKLTRQAPMRAPMRDTLSIPLPNCWNYIISRDSITPIKNS